MFAFLLSRFQSLSFALHNSVVSIRFVSVVICCLQRFLHSSMDDRGCIFASLLRKILFLHGRLLPVQPRLSRAAWRSAVDHSRIILYCPRIGRIVRNCGFILVHPAHQRILDIHGWDMIHRTFLGLVHCSFFVGSRHSAAKAILHRLRNSMSRSSMAS